MIDKLYYWILKQIRHREVYKVPEKPKSRFDYKLPVDLQPKDIDRFGKVDPSNPEAGKVTPEEKVDREDGVVEIPVGGIAPDGTIYEKIVRPDGNVPIYKEMNIDTEQQTTTTETQETETPNKTDTSDK